MRVCTGIGQSTSTPAIRWHGQTALYTMYGGLQVCEISHQWCASFQVWVVGLKISSNCLQAFYKDYVLHEISLWKTPVSFPSSFCAQKIPHDVTLNRSAHVVNDEAYNVINLNGSVIERKRGIPRDDLCLTGHCAHIIFIVQCPFLQLLLPNFVQKWCWLCCLEVRTGHATSVHV